MRSNAVGVKELGIFGNFDLKEKKKEKKERIQKSCYHNYKNNKKGNNSI